MAQRITWQNVAAPDLDGALRARIAASGMFDKAASAIGGAITGIDERNIDQENKMAVAEAMKIQDPEAWQKMMTGQGVAGLGIDPTRVNESLLKFTNGYRNQLTGQRETDRAYGASVFQDGKNAYDFERQQLGDVRTDAQLAADDAAKARQAEALAMVHGWVGGSSSKEDLIGFAENKAREMNADPLMMDAILGAASSVPDARWNVAEDIVGTANFLPEARVLNDALAAKENSFNMQYGANTAARLYGQAVQRSDGYANPSDGVIDRMLGKANPNAEEGEQALFSKSAGAIQDTINNLTKEYPHVDPRVIALALENNLQSDGIIFSGDQLKFDKSAVEAALAPYNDPKQLAALEQERAAIDNASADMAKDRADTQRAMKKWELAKDNKDDKGMERALAEMAVVAARVSPTAPAGASSSQGAPMGPPMPVPVPQGAPAMPAMMPPVGQAPNLSLGQAPMAAAMARIAGSPALAMPAPTRAPVPASVPVPTPANVPPEVAMAETWRGAVGYGQGAVDPRLAAAAGIGGGAYPTALGPQMDAWNIAASTPNAAALQVPGSAGPLSPGVDAPGLISILTETIQGERAYRQPDKIQTLLQQGIISEEEAQILARGSVKQADKLSREILKRAIPQQGR